MKRFQHSPIQNTQIKKRITKVDLLLIGALLLTGLISLFAVRIWMGKPGTTVCIEVDGSVYGTYDLETDQMIPITKDGIVTNVLQISNEKAKMIEANCPDKLCIHQNAISRQRETIVCLPNKIVAEIEGAQDAAFDSIAK